ncbi:MAG: hypothetical protein Q8K72_01115, partial [Acidimicrobiales bacterium]|nr:hypothetical protein [Acidimicrobiales bacterium]
MSDLGVKAVRRYLVACFFLLAAACGGSAGSEADQILAAAGGAEEEAPIARPIPTSTTAAPPSTAPATTTTTKRPAPTTTVAPPPRPRTTRVPVTPSPPIAGYSPAPPPPGVEPDGYGGYGGVTSVSAGGIAVELHVYAREQYFEQPTQVWVSVAHPVGVAITAITIDYGNGHVVNATPLARWTCGSPDDAPASANYTYPAPGRFRVTATA